MRIIPLFSSSFRRSITSLPRIANRTRHDPFARKFHASASRLINFDPYKTLGVDKGADQKEIKKKYYELVKKFHPDVTKEKDSEARFHKIQESYELLSDKEKRAQYDQFGSAAFDANGNSNPYAGNPFGGGGQGGQGGNPFGFDFEDLFSEAFGGGAGRGRGRGSFVTEHVGDNIEVLKTISFKESIFGKKVDINYKAVDTCNTCKGSGLKTGRKKKTCGTCHGTGQSTHVLGGFHMSSTCPSCGGAGVTIDKSDQCGSCHGHGVEEVPKSTTIELPCGIQDGTRLRVPGAGDAPFVSQDEYNRVRNGDLIIRVNVSKDPVFSRSGNNIVVKQKILMTTAALGGEIIVPTIDGQQIKLKVRPGVQSGRKMTIPDKGVPIGRNLNNRGDLEVELKVETLVAETPIQTALLEALADAYNDKNAKRTDAHWKLDIEDDPKVETYDEEANSTKNRIGKFLGRFFNMGEKKEKK